MPDWLLLAAISGGVVYLLMHRGLRRASRQLTELAASEGRFRDLTELSADWFWETDAEHRITWISAGGSVANRSKRIWSAWASSCRSSTSRSSAPTSAARA